MAYITALGFLLLLITASALAGCAAEPYATSRYGDGYWQRHAPPAQFSP